MPTIYPFKITPEPESPETIQLQSRAYRKRIHCQPKQTPWPNPPTAQKTLSRIVAPIPKAGERRSRHSLFEIALEFKKFKYGAGGPTGKSPWPSCPQPAIVIKSPGNTDCLRSLIGCTCWLNWIGRSTLTSPMSLALIGGIIQSGWITKLSIE